MWQKYIGIKADRGITTYMYTYKYVQKTIWIHIATSDSYGSINIGIQWEFENTCETSNRLLASSPLASLRTSDLNSVK